MRKAPILTALILLATFIAPFQSRAAQVAATGSNPTNCNQDVGNPTGVVAYRLAGGDCVVEFKNVGSTTWAVPSGVMTARILVIGGGGGGGSRIGGGGGAGEFVILEKTGLSGQITITTGQGGAGGIRGVADIGAVGGNSVFGSDVAVGGGGGGADGSAPTAKSDGSGGGGGYDSLGRDVDASTTTNFRNNGGRNNPGGSAPTATGGGGGGAGDVGSAGTNTTGGAGGLGKVSNITGADVFYAGGGAGGLNGGQGAVSTGNPALGGSGIGGNAGGKHTTNVSGTGCLDGGTKSSIDGCSGNPGSNNTGSGGGAASNGSNGGAGGSGIVIVPQFPLPGGSYATVSQPRLSETSSGHKFLMSILWRD